MDDTNLFRRACAFGGAAAFATSGVACATGGAACAAGAAACAAGAAACAVGAAACAWFGRAKLFKNPREKVKSTPGSKQMAVGYKKLNTLVSKRYLLSKTRESRGAYDCCLHPTVVLVGSTSTQIPMFNSFCKTIHLGEVYIWANLVQKKNLMPN